MLKVVQEQAQGLTKEILLDCCYGQDHTIIGSLSYINSYNGEIVHLGHLNHKEFVIETQQIFPGGQEHLDFDGKIQIEFTYFDGYANIYPDFGKSAKLALQEVQKKGFFP